MKKFAITLKWRGIVVLDGTCGAAIAYTNVKHFVTENFVGPPAEQGAALAPTLTELFDLPVGATLSGEVDSDQGHAAFRLERLED